KVIQERLNGSIPLIGFAGAPFTILSYLVEGKSSRDFKLTKTLLNNDPKLAHYILQKITDLTVDYLNMQIAAGVNAVQLFDSWAMALTWNDYIEFGHAYTQQIISRINREGIPVISFARGSSVFYPIMSEAKPDVISLDWNADILNVKNNLPKGIAVQGNFDPIILYADKPVIRKKIHELFERMRGQDGFLFNLGHGIMPDMSFDHVKYAVDVI
ncbi:putative uroporphyrinogen decarboxylase, partial [Sphingobacterium spiritivorum ATCC 33300]